MKATDLRNATFDNLRHTLEESRLVVYTAWQLYGPATTRDAATKAGIDILTLRPRTTELLQMGLIMLTGRHGHQGIYAVAADHDWNVWQQQNFPADNQLRMI